jgi:hypothetical protein
MHMAFSLSATNAVGKVVKTRHGAVDYDFHGYNSRSREANASFHGWKSRDKAVGTVAGASTITNMMLLAPEAEQAFRMQVVNSQDDETMVAEFAPIGECHPIWANEVDLPADMCGNIKVQLRKDDLSMKSVTFEIAGMPIQGEVDYLGHATINRDYVVIDFKEIMLPGDPKPFVVPSHVTCTLETNKGKLLISGDFTVKKNKKK